MIIHYIHYPSPIGSLVLAATNNGLCVIVFVGGKDKATVDDLALEKALAKHLPREVLAPEALPLAPKRTSEADPPPTFRRSPTKLAPARRWLDRYFAGQNIDAEALEMPLELHGTPFQLKVWKQLARIPYGQTVSYGDIAKRLRQPGAARAVGMANNRNPLPILIPCHRVVGANGKLVGYGGGLWRKKALLRLEEGDLFGPV